jgi:hypothetical protein
MPYSLVQSVARASTLLRVLAADGGYLQLGVIAAASQLPKSTAHGICRRWWASRRATSWWRN